MNKEKLILMLNKAGGEDDDIEFGLSRVDTSNKTTEEVSQEIDGFLGAVMGFCPETNKQNIEGYIKNKNNKE